MKNIKNTTKYMKTITITLIAAVFSVISPVVALADTTWSNSSGGDSSGWTNSSGGDSSGWTNSSGGDSSGWTNSSGGDSSGWTNSSGGDNNIVQTYVPAQVSTVYYSNPYNNYSPNYVGSSMPAYDINYNSNPVGIGMPVSPIVQQPVQVTPNPVFSGVSPVYYNTQPVTYYTQPATVPNQVLAYTDTNPNLDSVYLSDIPATGFEDTLPMIIFISSLVLWSAILAFVFLKRKIDLQNVFAKAYVSEVKINSTDSTNSDFVNQMASDNSDVSKVEEYARMNKVLLSSDASVKLVKLSRLGQINASEYIRSIATGEWIAIGENQIIA